MSILNWLWKRKRYEFTDKDSSLGVEVRQYKQELKRLQYEREKIKAEMELEKIRADMADLKDQLYGTEEEVEVDSSPEKMLMNMFMMQMLKQTQNTTATTGTTTNTDIYMQNASTKRKYSNQELEQMKDNIPKKYLKKARKMSEADLMPLVRNNLPDADEDSIARAIVIIRE